MMGGIMGIAAALFGVFWTALAASSGAMMMVPFGVIFVFIAIAQCVYNFKNATGKNRFSAFDVVKDNEEPDPLNTRFGGDPWDAGPSSPSPRGERAFCPYCGAKAGEDFCYCPKCGRKLP